MQSTEQQATFADDALPRGSDRGSPDRRKRRLFMAGRVDGQVQQVRFASSVRAPIRGPWSLALVVRPG